VGTGPASLLDLTAPLVLKQAPRDYSIRYESGQNRDAAEAESLSCHVVQRQRFAGRNAIS